MSEMVERLARAMCDDNWDAKDFTQTLDGADPEDAREYWRLKARAVLEAMRDPTPSMVEAGQAVDGTISAGPVFTAMINDALK